MKRVDILLRSLLFGTLAVVGSTVAVSEVSEEWKEVLSRIDVLQANPLAADAKEQGAWLVKWIINSKQVSVTLCAPLTVELTKKGDEVGGLLAVHSLLGATEYAMTTPADQQSKSKMYGASMNGALDAYQKAVGVNENLRRKHVDEVLKVREAGQLDEYVQKHSKKCDQ
jgi:hypothetical protein